MKLGTKKALSLFLALVMIISTFTIGIIPANASMAQGETWIAINNKYDLKKIENNPNGNYYLTEDIEFTDRDYLSSGDFSGGFKGYMYEFRGKIDGRGHSIVNLETFSDYFIYYNYGTIENLIFSNYKAFNNKFSAYLVYYNYGNVKNVHIKDSSMTCMVDENKSNANVQNCTISGTDGYFVDLNYGTIESCVNKASITQRWGICRCNLNVIKGCIFSGILNATGGVYGICDTSAASTSSIVYNCAFTGSIITSGTAFGIGNVYKSISNCLNAGSISGNTIYSIGNNAQDCVNIGSYSLVGSNAVAYGIGKDCYNCYTRQGSCSTTTKYSNKILSDNELVSQLKNDEYFDFNNIWQIKNGKVSLQIENQKYIIATPYYFPTKLDYLLDEKLNTDGLLLMKFDNFGDYEVMADDEYTINYSTAKLGTAKVEIVTDFDTFTYYINVYDDIKNQNISINEDNFVYTGSEILPNVIVKTKRGITLIKNKEYRLEYENNISPGKAKVTVIGLGNYTGSKTLYYVIKPAKVVGVSIADRTASSITLSWTKQSNVSGYAIQRYNSSTGSWSTIKTLTSNVNATTIGGLSAGKEYKFRVRAYVNVDGTKHYGSYSSSVKKYTLPQTPSISNLSKATIGFTAKWTKASAASGYEIQYSKNKNFSSKKTVTVNKNNTLSKTIKGLSANTTYYVRVRSYKNVNGSKIYSKWSSTKSIKTPTVSVAKPRVTSFYTSSNGKVITKWSKVSGVSGYQVEYGRYFRLYGDAYLDWQETKTFKGASTTSYSMSDYGDYHLVRVRAYKIVDGKKYYSGWSSTRVRD